MFASRFRRSSRLKPSFSCRSSLSILLNRTRPQRSSQLRHGAITLTSSLATIANNGQAVDTKKPSSNPEVDGRHAEGGQAVGRHTRRTATLSSSRKDKPREKTTNLNGSLRAEAGNLKVVTTGSGEAEGVHKGKPLKKEKGIQNGQEPEIRGTTQQSGAVASDSRRSARVEGSTDGVLATKAVSKTQIPAKNRLKMSTVLQEDDDERNKKLKILRQRTRLRGFYPAFSRQQSAFIAKLLTKTLEGSFAFPHNTSSLDEKLHGAPTRQMLVKIIQDDQLSDADRSRAMLELRSTLINRVESQHKVEVSGESDFAISNDAKSRMKKSKDYWTIKDAIQLTSLTHKRATPQPFQRRRTIDRNVRDKVARQVTTGPMKTKPGLVGYEIKSIDAEELLLIPVEKVQRPVPSLSYGLERVLFNPGVYHLQDPRSRVFNFDPYLQSIMPVNQFDFNALKQYITSSRDESLLETAAAEKKKYTGSTSSMTSALGHFHFLLSQWRPVNTGTLSRNFPAEFNTFTALQRGPSAIFLRWRNGTYAIDADKEYDTGNILSMLGKSMEKLLTLSTEDFEKYRKDNSDQISEEARNEAESFHYTTMGDFLMRSQLDAHDSRLPGTGMFDLKTRAVVSIRMDTKEYEQGKGYEIRGRHGEWESFEREYYDMIRAAFLKYSLQVRMGRMDGIFVAFHNTERIFGFQYISLPEMDFALHGSEDTTTGDSEFKLSLELLNRVLDRATAKYPEKSLRIHFETRGVETPFMYIFAEPVEEGQIQEIQESNKAAIEEFEHRVLGLHSEQSEEEILEEQKTAEWEHLRAKVEQSMNNDELEIEDARAMAEGLVEESEILRSGAMSVEETERRMDELLSHAGFVENSQEREDYEVHLAKEDRDVIAEDSANGAVADADDVDEKFDGDDGFEEEEFDKDEELADETEGSEINNAEHANIPNSKPGGSETESKPGNTEISNKDLLSWKVAESRKGGGHLTKPEDPEKVDEVMCSSTLQHGLGSAQSNRTNSKETSEVIAMTLTIRNKVNSKYVERPMDISSTDKWTVEYALAEVPSQPRARKLYEAAKARRRKILNNENNDAKNAWNNQYINILRKLSQKGRDWRRGQNEIDQVAPPKILDVKNR